MTLGVDAHDDAVPPGGAAHPDRLGSAVGPCSTGWTRVLAPGILGPGATATERTRRSRRPNRRIRRSCGSGERGW